MLFVNIKKVIPDAVIPKYATDGSACFDFVLPHKPEWIQDASGFSVIINTGLVFEIPEDYMMLIYPRSGLGFKWNLKLSNTVGVVDSDFRGAVLIKLTTPFIQFTQELAVGDRVAQGCIIPYPKCTFVEHDKLSDTNRQGGFGSTGR
jgi:dUTP pyrophosphatase